MCRYDGSCHRSRSLPSTSSLWHTHHRSPMPTVVVVLVLLSVVWWLMVVLVVVAFVVVVVLVLVLVLSVLVVEVRSLPAVLFVRGRLVIAVGCSSQVPILLAFGVPSHDFRRRRMLQVQLLLIHQHSTHQQQHHRHRPLRHLSVTYSRVPALAPTGASGTMRSCCRRSHRIACTGIARLPPIQHRRRSGSPLRAVVNLIQPDA